MVVSFLQVKEYLGIIGENAESASHAKFWNVSYSDFIEQKVPNQKCEGLKFPIINKDSPPESPFLLVQQASPGFCGKPRMPLGGPFLDDEYTATLADGRTVTGTQILTDIKEWLEAGYPETS